jgi:hypothetical protein
MEIRQYDIYIDGLRLPEYFFPDADTQMWERNDFTFAGCVERSDAAHDLFGDVVDDSELFDPDVPNFARLMRKLSFRLGWCGEQGVAVRVCSRGGPIQWQVYGAGNEMHEVTDNVWRKLRWGCTYVLHGDNFGEPRQMTVEVQRCRPPLAELRRSAFNRTRPPRQLARHRRSS